MIFIAEVLGRSLAKLLGDILRHVEVGEILFTVLQDVHWIDDARLVEEHARAVEEEPGDGEIDDDGDVDGLAEACTGALIVEAVEEVDELVFFKFSVASGAYLRGLGGVGRCLYGWHRLWLRRLRALKVAPRAMN